MGEESSTDAAVQAEVQETGSRTLATPLVPLAQQVGNHVMGALSQTDTVAVISTITGSRTGQQVVSMTLTAEQMGMVNQILQQVEESEEPAEIGCVGFHCDLPAPD